MVEGLRARGISQIVVCDNGSSDQTANVARSAGATVVHEPERGYGAACLKAISALSQVTEIIGQHGDGGQSHDLETLLSPLFETSRLLTHPVLGAEQERLPLNVSQLLHHPGSNTVSSANIRLGTFRAIRQKRLPTS